MNCPAHAIAFCAAAVLLLAGAGCDRPSDVELDYLQAQEQERQQRELLKNTTQGRSEENTAIAFVKEWPAADGDGTMADWVGRQTAGQGDILFPAWQARRRGTGKYEVRFTCTTVATDGGSSKKGYGWTADLLIKTVTPPREIPDEELGQRSSKYFKRRTAGTVREPLRE